MMGVDRTSNRAWKRRRNYVIAMRPIFRMNGYEKAEILRRVMETRPGLDERIARRLLERCYALQGKG